MNGSRRYLLDTNILLRFFTGEPELQAAAARKLFIRAKMGEIVLEITPVIVAETYYTLLSFYGAERKEASIKLTHLLRQRGVRLREGDLVMGALDRLQTANVGFADAYLAAGAAGEKLAIASFDRDFDKFKDITRYEPMP